MNTRLNLVALLSVGFLASASFAQDPSGTWRWEHEDLEGSGEIVPDVLKLTYDNGKVGGVYVSPEGDLPIENATFDGETLHWELNLDGGGQTLNLAWTGKISGDDVNGTIKFGDFGEFPWTAKRDARVAASATGIWRWEHDDAASGQTLKDVLTLTSNGSAVSGSYDMGDGVTHVVKDGKLDGNTLTWNIDLDAGGQMMKISFSGAINGDALAGTVTLGDFGEFPWAAARDAERGVTRQMAPHVDDARRQCSRSRIDAHQ